ncbi:MAG: hypothetical protein ACFUZC_13035 [Chthoniobacteraceae bacterium]
MTVRIARYFAPLILFEWGAVLGYFYLSHRLNGLLHPAFRLPVLVTGFLLIIAGGCVLFSKECRCAGEACRDRPGDRTAAESWRSFLVLLLPILLASRISPDIYGAVSVNNRGVADSLDRVPGALARATPQGAALSDLPTQAGPPDSDNGSLTADLPKGWVPPNAPQFGYSKDIPDAEYPSNQRLMELLRDDGPKKAPLRALNERRDTTTPFGSLNEILGMAAADSSLNNAQDPGGRTVPVDVIELLSAAGNPDLQRKLAGRDIDITGQVLDSNGGNFRVMRLLILCCAADAQPLAVQVRAHGLHKPPQMTWVKITGRVAFTAKGKATIPVIDAREIAVVTQPEEPFLY